MTSTTAWRSAVSGNFDRAGLWSDGEPTSTTAAVIDAKGTAYTVTVNSADVAASLTLDSNGATFLETSAGSLNIGGAFEIDKGVAVLGGTNTIGSIDLAGGTVDFSDSGALGAGTVSLSGSAKFVATGSAEIGNAIAVSGIAAISADNGSTLILDGSVTFDSAVADVLNFRGDNSGGVVELNAPDGSAAISPDGGAPAEHVNIWGETLELTTANGLHELDDCHVNLSTDGIFKIDAVSGTLAASISGSGEFEIGGVCTNNLAVNNNSFFGEWVFSSGYIEMSSPDGLGEAAVNLDNEIFDDLVSSRLQNALSLKSNVGIETTHGGLTLQGSLHVASGTDIDFGVASAPEHRALQANEPDTSGGGLCILNFSSFSSDDDTYTIGVAGSTIKSTLANETSYDTLLTDAATITLSAGGILDLTGQNGITLHNLSGTGTILNTGTHESLTIATTPYPQYFAGTIRGDFDITATGGDIFTGSTFALKKGDTIHMTGDFDLVELNGVTFNTAAPNIDMGTGSNGTLSIDNGYAGTISNFGNSDGIVISGETYETGLVHIHYTPNSEHTGGVLAVKIGTQPVIDLQLSGSYTTSDFQVFSAVGGVKIDLFATIGGDHDASNVSSHLAHIVDALI